MIKGQRLGGEDGRELLRALSGLECHGYMVASILPVTRLQPAHKMATSPTRLSAVSGINYHSRDLTF
jgi:hypothetical protein